MAVTYNDVTFEDDDDQINSGTAISMQCTRVSMDFSTALQVEFRPGLSVTTETHDNLLGRGDFVGFENPSVVFEGVIDLTTYDASTGAAPASRINLVFLQQMVKSGSIFTVNDKFDSGPSTAIYRTCGLLGTLPNETVDNYKVMITGLRIETNPSDSKEGHIIKYTLSTRMVSSAS